PAIVESVPAHGIVPDDRRVADLGDDALPQVVLNQVALEEGGIVIDVGPEAWPGVVMDKIVSDDEPVGEHELRATRLEVEVTEGIGVIISDLVTLDQNIVSSTADPELPIVMDVRPADLHAMAKPNTEVRVVPHLGRVYDPT